MLLLPLSSPHFSPLCLLLPLSMLLSSGSARRWLSALPLLWLCGCDDDDYDDGVSRAYRGTALTYATHVCMCVCMCVSVAFVCAQLIYDISFIVIGQQLSTVLELSFCLCPLQCAHCLALSLPLSLYLSLFLSPSTFSPARQTTCCLLCCCCSPSCCCCSGYIKVLSAYQR